MSEKKDLCRNVVREVGADKVRAFSSFDDFLTHLIAHGKTGSLDELMANDDLLIEVIFHWYRQGQIACVFARNLAQDPESAKWRSEVVRPGFNASALNNRIDELVGTSEAVQLIFPGLTTAKNVADLVVKLCKTGRWSCQEVEWKFDERSRLIPVGLRWEPSDRSYTSWALGLASFEPMPFTRRFVGAPFTVVAFRASPPTSFIPPKTDPVSGQIAAHLAHMDDGFGADQKLRERVHKLTSDNKFSLLASDLWSTARAQVSFAFPDWCRRILDSVLQSSKNTNTA